MGLFNPSLRQGRTCRSYEENRINSGDITMSWTCQTSSGVQPSITCCCCCIIVAEPTTRHMQLVKIGGKREPGWRGQRFIVATGARYTEELHGEEAGGKGICKHCLRFVIEIVRSIDD